MPGELDERATLVRARDRAKRVERRGTATALVGMGLIFVALTGPPYAVAVAALYLGAVAWVGGMVVGVVQALRGRSLRKQVRAIDALRLLPVARVVSDRRARAD